MTDYTPNPYMPRQEDEKYLSKADRSGLAIAWELKKLREMLEPFCSWIKLSIEEERAEGQEVHLSDPWG